MNKEFNSSPKSLGKISALQKAAKEYIFGPPQCKYNNIKKNDFFNI